MTFSGPYEGIQWPYGRILNGGDKKSERWLPIGVNFCCVIFAYSILHSNFIIGFILLGYLRILVGISKYTFDCISQYHTRFELFCISMYPVLMEHTLRP